MSDSEDSTVTYTTVSNIYLVRSGDVSPGEDGPPEDPADYPTDHDDDEEEEEEPYGDNLLSSNHRADRPKVTLPPRKRLSIVHRPGYEARESSAAVVARPIAGRRADYGFVGSVEAEIRRRIAEDIGYGIRDTWIDPRDVAKEEALMTLEGVNTRVTELAAGRQTEIFERVEALVDDSHYHYETGRLVDQEARCSRKAWAHSIGLSSAVHFELQGYMTYTWVQDQRIDAQDTLIATLTIQLTSLQGHLVTALGKIQALQAREQARAGTPKGAGSST
nr:hypothetical protein [Tanacetum cinerariifolium]